MRVLDLCSGLGGASEAFVRAGDEVTRVDNDPRFKSIPFTVIADVRTFDEGVEWDVILAAPPCTLFSYAREQFGYEYPSPGVPDAIALVRSIQGLAKRHPRAIFVMENPRGHLAEEIGPPRETVY